MQNWAIGVDLGGTKIEIAIVSDKGELLDRSRIPTPHTNNPEDVIDNITTSITALLSKNPHIIPSVIGIGVAGQVNKDTGIVMDAPNLGWHNVDLQRIITEKLNIATIICNDVKAAAWGEWKCGAGVGSSDILCIFIGTGIGGAIISSNHMMHGCNNTAGEIGHTILQMNGPECHCGNKGCFEALAGGWALKRDAQQAVKNNMVAGITMLALAGGDIAAIDGKTVSDAQKKGDPLAQRLTDNLASTLAAGIVSAINLTGPCKVILGGGAIEGMPELVDMIRTKTKNYALKAAITPVELLAAKLHNDSGVIGAALFALHNMNNSK